MRPMSRRVIAVFFVLIASGVLWQRASGPEVSARAPPATEPAGRSVRTKLPAEARDTIDLIRQGGPFPYRQDGQEFGNREGLLPDADRGFYREYTVSTPGSANRGARRIVTGGTPPWEWYYTEDHYRSFRPLAQQEISSP
ncbi:MAG: ribonuclease domain-containing protein [Gammaproteobacteria bacterium]